MADTQRTAQWALANKTAAKRQLDKLDAETHLIDFIQLMWPVLEPGTKFIDGWAIRAICEHLEAVTAGKINRLLINVPPGSMKSLTTNVFWPAWEWGPKRMPHTRYVAAAYAEQLTLRDNRKCLALMKSPEYQDFWGDVFELDKDEQSKGKFANLDMGFKLATAVGGSATGERGDRVIIDDPHNVKDAESEAKRMEALYWFTEVMPSRVNSEQSAIVIIMQRVHQEDISGLILEEELGYEHLCIPMHFDPDHIHKSNTSIGWVDPRTKDGDLMWPELFPRSRVERDEKVMRSVGGEYAVAGQHEQRPTPRGGGMFQEDDFQFIDVKDVPQSGRLVRGWDLAATKDGRAAYTVGLKMRRTRDGNLYIEDVRRARETPAGVDKMILQAATDDGTSCVQDLPQDPGAAGKTVKAHMALVLEGFNFHITTESGSKEDRARPLASQCEAGKIHLVRAPWNKEFLKEVCVFPAGKFKDQVDAASRAYARLLKTKPRKIAVGPTIINAE
jgi:predicted phage terminase large subunit-like protein